MTTRRARGRHWLVFTVAVFTTLCGAVWMVSTWDEVRHSNGVSVHREKRSPEEIRRYWTPERLRNAKPG